MIRSNNWYTKVYLSILIILLILPLVSSAPPVTTTQQFATGYFIRIPQDNILKVNADYKFDFHVFNLTNGVPKVDGISCEFHLYNQSGRHIVIANTATVDDRYDYEFFVNGKNFSTLGAYYYNIQCNSTVLGGDEGSVLYVTNTGEANVGDNVLLFFFIAFILLGIFLIYLFLFSLGHFMQKNFDLNDLAIDYGMFFGLVIFYVLELQYLNNPMMNAILEPMVYVAGFTNIVASTIFFIITMIWNGMLKNRQESGGGDY